MILKDKFGKSHFQTVCAYANAAEVYSSRLQSKSVYYCKIIQHIKNTSSNLLGSSFYIQSKISE
jgi:hypothetical protein